MQTTVESRIAAPPEAVFAVVTDIARWPEIITAVERIDILTAGPIAVGTRFRETRRMFGREATEVMTIAELAAPHRFVLTAHNHGTRYRAAHHVTPVSTGTLLHLAFEGHPESLLARIMVPMGLLMLEHVRKQLARDLDDVKRAAEAR